MPSAEAIAELEEIIAQYPDSPVAHEAHLTLARYFASLGDARAYHHYQEALALDTTPALKMEWAHYLEAAGNFLEAYTAYREVFRRFPEETKDALKRLAPDPLTLARDLLDFGFPQDALEMLPSPSESEPAEVLALRARALMALGQVEEALFVYEAWLGLIPDSVDARLGRAQALAGLGRSEEALNIYAGILTISAQLARGELLAGLSRKEEALAIYLGLEDPVAWWRAAGILEELGREGVSLPLYDQVARSASVLADDASFRMWILSGRLGDTMRKNAAVQLLEGVGPNYFTLLVKGVEFSADLASPPPAPSSALSVLEKSQALEEIGFSQWAIQELVYAARATDDAAADLAFAKGLYLHEAWREASLISDAILKEYPTDSGPLIAWRLSYPKAYLQQVEDASREFGVDPLLIWSVMRQESHFYPEAVSLSYAQGLMQVIPSTRDEIARQLKVAADKESMFNPATSIRFGAYYLGIMLKRFGGEVEYAVAAYNGGGGTVENTLNLPLVRERIDFYRWLIKGQSREFLNRVMLNLAIYQWLEENEG